MDKYNFLPATQMETQRQYPQFKFEFELVCHLENIEDFENQWSHIVAEFEVVQISMWLSCILIGLPGMLLMLQVSVAANATFQDKEMIPYLPIKACLSLEEHA